MGLFSLTLLASAGYAQSARAEESEADKLFRDARAEMKAGRFGQGCQKFKESFQLDPTAGTMLNIGDCEEKQHHLSASFNAFARGLKMLPTSDARSARTAERLGQLSAKLAWLKVDLPPEVEVLIDDSLVDAYDGKFAIDPGDHAVRLRRNNASDVLVAVTARVGETKKLDSSVLKPVDAPVQSGIPRAWTTRDPKEVVGTTQTTSWTLDTRAAEKAEKADSGRRTASYVAFGVAGAGIAVGTVSGIIALNAASAVKSDCTPIEGTSQLRCGERGADAAKRGKTTSAISTVGFGTAIAAGATGLVLFLTSSPSAPAASAEKKTGFSVLPMAGTDIAGATIIGRM